MWDSAHPPPSCPILNAFLPIEAKPMRFLRWTRLPAYLAALTAPFAQTQAAPPDLILIHGHILTIDAKDSIAQAIAVRHGIILKVGTDAEIQALPD